MEPAGFYLFDAQGRILALVRTGAPARIEAPKAPGFHPGGAC